MLRHCTASEHTTTAHWSNVRLGETVDAVFRKYNSAMIGARTLYNSEYIFTASSVMLNGLQDARGKNETDAEFSFSSQLYLVDDDGGHDGKNQLGQDVHDAKVSPE